MIFKTGLHNKYSWIETSDRALNLGVLLKCYSHFVLNKHLAIISFDSDTFVPTPEEMLRGWTQQGEIAYFPNLTKEELAQSIYDNSYDQWLLFDHYKEIKEMDIYVNYSGFSLSQESEMKSAGAIEVSKDFLHDVRNRFWQQIEEIKPSKFVLQGNNFIYGTTNEAEILQIKKDWC